jgi:hypothetical protein
MALDGVGLDPETTNATSAPSIWLQDVPRSCRMAS